MIEVKKLIEVYNYYLLINQHIYDHKLRIHSSVYIAVVEYHLVNLETVRIP